MLKQKTIFIILLLTLLISGCTKLKSDKDAPFSKIEEEVSNFEKRTIYKELTEETLRKVPDEMLEVAILDYIDLQINKSNQNTSRTLKKLNKSFQIIYITYNFDEKVSSEGFAGFFMNEEKIFIPDLLNSLREIKAFTSEKIATDAISIYNKYREAFLDGNTDEQLKTKAESELDRIDESFYRKNEDLKELRKIYIKEHLRDFITK